MVAVAVADKPAETPFARWLYDLMRTRRLSARAISTYAGVAPSTVGDWIYKGTEPKRESIDKLAAWLHVPYAELRAVVDGDRAAPDIPAGWDDEAREIAEEFDALLMRMSQLRRRLPWNPRRALNGGDR